jgi:hypothetical protein
MGRSVVKDLFKLSTARGDAQEVNSERVGFGKWSKKTSRRSSSTPPRNAPDDMLV